MKIMFRLALVAGLVFLLVNEPPKRAEAEVQQPVVVSKAEAPKVVDTTSVTPTAPAPVPQPEPVAIDLTKQEIMTQAGIPESEWAAVDYIVSHESSWRHLAVNSSSGATGLCQSLPASKMSSAGADYLTNPVTQLIWCNNYAQTRYGGWWSAYNFWLSNRWW